MSPGPFRSDFTRPVVSVTLVGPAGSKASDALLDTGADDTLFPEQLAAAIGIDLASVPPLTGAGIGGNQILVRYSLLSLRLTDGKEFREWPAWVGFTSAKMKHPVLGFAGCLQFFTATFRGDIEEVELEVNRLYSGS